LASGPGAGLGEINLPAVQGGSSIMPGKVNPVIPEVLNQIAFEVVGSDLTVTMAVQAGQLQLNAFEPVIAVALFRSLRQMRAGCVLLAERCVSGITANPAVLARNVGTATSALTALVPRLGYELVTQLGREAALESSTVAQVVLRRGLLSAGELASILGQDPVRGPADGVPSW
jgi:aspartate ammonia-lyase